MHGIISALKASNLFNTIDVLELIDEDCVKLLKIKAKALDGTILYITELHTRDYQKYSYHWQKENGELIVRWDNKPHSHKEYRSQTCIFPIRQSVAYRKNSHILNRMKNVLPQSTHSCTNFPSPKNSNKW